MPGPPEFNIDFYSFNADPYPMLVVLRREAPVAFVPQLGSTLPFACHGAPAIAVRSRRQN